MPFNSTKLTEFGDCYLDISKTDKRWIRATLKTYEMTGTYVYLKLIKKAESDYEFQQRVSTVQEFKNLIERSADIRSQFTEEEPPAKKHDSNKYQKKFLRPTPATKIVESMYDRSQNYFEQIQKQFNFQIVEEKPTLSNKSVYAVCAQFDSESCGLVTNHYHVLLDTKTFEKETLKWNQNFAVPCVLQTFIFLFSTAGTLQTNGDVFTNI